MAARENGRRALFVAGLAVVIAADLAIPVGPTSVAAEAVLTVVSISTPMSLVAPVVASSPSVSGDGQFVVFTSAPATPPEVAENQPASSPTSSIWLNDRLNGEITELTLAKEATRLGNSVNPVISTDGCTVVIATETAYDLFRDDDSGARWDIYRATLPKCGGKLGEWAIVSTFVNAAGQAQARNDVEPTQRAAVSSAGAVVAYMRPFESLAGDDDSGSDDPARSANAIDVVDLSIPIDDLGRTVETPGLPSDLPSNSIDYAGQISPALSADGSTLVFASDATADQAVPDWTAPLGAATTVVTQIFAWDRADADPFTAVSLISAAAGAPGDFSSVDPTVSADGSVIAFSSAASNMINAEALTQCGNGCPPQVYVFDRDADGNAVNDEDGFTSMTLVSQAGGVPGEPIVIGNGASFGPSLSADGISVAFSTQASNLLQVQTPGGGEAGDGDLLIADLANASLLRRAFDGLTPAPGAHGRPHISANGRVLVADSLVAGQLVGDPTLSGRHIVAATYSPTLSIAALDLGTITLSVPGQEWVVNVVNVGPGAFEPAEVSIDNPDFAITGGSCVTDRAAVKPGTSCGITIILTPSVAGPISANLTVAEVGFGAIVLTSPVKGAGGEPALDAFPDSADYGAEVVGRLSRFTEIFQVSNVYVLPTVVTSATMGGANPDDFIITSSTCGGELFLGASCPVEVSFRPTGAGRRTATLNFTTTLGQYTSVLLSGEGLYTPSLLTSVQSAGPGEDLGVGGLGFPANTELVLGWSDGSGRSVTVTTDGDGVFLTNIAIPRSHGSGPATVVAQTDDGTSASVAVEVERTPRRSPRQRG